MRSWWRSSDVVEDNMVARMVAFAATAIADIALALTAGASLSALATIAVAGVGHVVSYRGRHRRRTAAGQLLLGGILVLGLVYLLLDITIGIFGGELPQARFGLIAQAATSFDLKSRRNLFSHIWISATILYVGALFAWDPGFVVYVAAWSLCFFGFLMATAQALSPEPAAWRAWVARRGRRAVPAVVAWLLLGALLFVALPRLAGRPLAVPLLVSIPLGQESGEVLPAVLPLVGTAPEGGESGINLRIRGRLGDEVMFRVRAPAASYWRAYVLEEYRGQEWGRVLHPARPLPPIATNIPVDGETTTIGPGLPQTFYIQRPLPAEVLVSYPVRELYFPARQLVLTSTGTVHAPYGLRRGVNYAAVSQVRDTSAERLRALGPVTDAGRQGADADLEVSRNVPRRVYDLAQRLAGDKPTEFDQVQAIGDYLRTRYRYSLDTPRLPAEADAVDRFLFVDRVGFCEQFASAYAILLREVGIPTRLAVGFSTGDHDALTGSFTVHARDAHAWIEVLFPGAGWIPFDASPGFDSSPTAHAPSRWFLSDLTPQLALTGISGLPAGSVAPIAVGAFALIVIVVLLRMRRAAVDMPHAVRTYMLAQPILAFGRLPRRRDAETPAEHLRRLGDLSSEAALALKPVVTGAERALYSRDVQVAGPSLGPLLRAAIGRRLARLVR